MKINSNKTEKLFSLQDDERTEKTDNYLKGSLSYSLQNTKAKLYAIT